MVGWHYRLNGHKFEQTPGDSEGQGSMAYRSMGRKESDMTDRLNNNRLQSISILLYCFEIGRVHIIIPIWQVKKLTFRGGGLPNAFW